jgi:hypothetical protein
VRERLPGLFSGIDWGSERVSDQTLAALARAGIDTEALEPRVDIDRPEDLPAWDKIRAAWYEPPRTLSVVIPTLDEEPGLARLLNEVAHVEAETIVVDGGSADGTPDIGASRRCHGDREPRWSLPR